MSKTLPRVPLLIVCSLLVPAAALMLAVYSSSAQSSGARRPAPFSHALPQMDGSHLRTTVVEVNYTPGEADEPHSHPCVVIGYVAQGTIRFQVKGEPETVYKTLERVFTRLQMASTKYPPTPATRNPRN
jgi:hypothetical protein